MSALVLNNVGKDFGGVHAVADLHMEVPQGRITGLIGPNGAGKTTVVNMISGMLSVTSGAIKFGTHDITHVGAHDAAALGISRTYQNIRLLSESTVTENVMGGFHRHEKASILASLLGLPSSRRETAKVRRQALEMIDRFEMSAFHDHPAGDLSYGHQRRVEMMRALAMAPELLLLDEPVAGMNEVESGELGTIFSGLAKGGMAVLLIEHNMRFVFGLCDFVYVLDSGRLIASGTPDEVIKNPAVITAYLGS
jgi:branched-chain amino acid transport system ATP-binding protein